MTFKGGIFGSRPMNRTNALCTNRATVFTRRGPYFIRKLHPDKIPTS